MKSPARSVLSSHKFVTKAQKWSDISSEETLCSQERKALDKSSNISTKRLQLESKTSRSDKTKLSSASSPTCHSLKITTACAAPVLIPTLSRGNTTSLLKEKWGSNGCETSCCKTSIETQRRTKSYSSRRLWEKLQRTTIMTSTIASNNSTPSMNRRYRDSRSSRSSSNRTRWKRPTRSLWDNGLRSSWTRSKGIGSKSSLTC